MRQATRWAMVMTVVLAAVIAFLTLRPPIETGMPAGSDKLYHFIAFAALSFPLALVRPRWSAGLLVLFTAYGAAIEIIQPYMGRSGEWADLLADVTGILGGIAAGLLIRHLLQQKRGGRQSAGGMPGST
ncbi:MAG: VanZ family protein [Propionibacteriaceae bacterium]|nr:VanZ family protein [Propionibacteriaceae bacterium]